MSTIAPYRPAVAGHTGFAQLVHAEWTKFRTVRGWLIGLFVAALLMVLLGVFTASGSHAGICINNKCTGMPPLLLGPEGGPVNDDFTFVHQPLAGNGSITVRVTSLTGSYSSHGGVPVGAGQATLPQKGTQPWSKAGIIIKQNTKQGSAYAAVMLTGTHGVRMQYNYTHDIAGPSGRWLRLARSGNVLTGYVSTDGSHWTTIGTTHLTGLTGTVQAGLFAASPDHSVTKTHLGGVQNTGGPSQAAGTFDHLSLTGGQPHQPWAPTAVGSGGFEGYHHTGGTVTVSGSGDIAPDVQSGETIDKILVGAFAGLIALVVVGTMFIAAEYRRGLIRITLAANPRRGRVLAAKALVVGAAAFVVGAIAGLIAIPIAEPILRHNGNRMYPASTLTDLRVILGTAALLAVASIAALAVGTMLRRSAGAITAVIAAIVLPYILATASLIPTGAAQWLLRLTPAAAFAIQQVRPAYHQVTATYLPGDGYYPLAPWAGFAVLCGYTAIALGAAVVLLRRRDA
ncbi:MAG TPA: ABC transporter permease subunit [Mycobacteriales bacterium]|nr:ABC transporter permease subunit [Mycobacteriales bacterium]